MPGSLERLRQRVRLHPRATAAAAGSALAGIVALVVRQRAGETRTLPRPGEIGATTAIAVHNAAKGEVIRVVRTAETPRGTIVGDAASDVVAQAIESGVDIAPAAVGAVEGALEIAHLVGESPLAAGQRAAAAALQAAEAHSEAAGQRVRDVLAPYFEPRAALPDGA
ncbi:MAG: hypothetical protein AB7F65_02675 [Dehalococcoidia bacterium]